ncbi:MAG: hypothetical protein SGJ15_13555 [Bacteroidota bacterium]|nr:hypothetical protein [Bacteroidota bacterium]
MKTNIIIKTCLTTAVALALVFTSCRKKEMEDSQNTDSLSAHADDSQMQASTTDEAYSDADNSASAARSIAGNPTTSNPVNTSTVTWPCDATVDSSQISQGIILLTFNGSGCSGKVRAGQMKFQLANYSTGARWRDVGAQLTVNLINYKVTRNGKNLTMNGTHNLVNVSGGLVSDLSLEKPTIVRTITSNDMNILFDGNTTRIWNVSKKRTWEYNGGNTKLTITGEANVGNYSSVCAWGTNRKGKTFTTQITSPVVCLKSCGWGRPISGVKVHNIEEHNATVTLGTNSNGDVDSGSCPNNFKVEWTGRKGKQREHIGTYR